MTLLIRADASTKIGTGHVMRCLALAQGWQSAGGQAVFAQAESTPTLEQRLRGERMEVVRLNSAPGTSYDVAQTVEHARMHQASWIVADGYCFGATWQKRIKAAGFRLLILDDYGHTEHYYADLVLNQNVSANERLYAQREPSTQLLLGTCYALLRHEFLEWRNWQRKIPAIAHKILVTLGGSDPYNVTLEVLRALQDVSIKPLEIVVVAGAANPHLKQIKAAVPATNEHMQLLTNVTKMPSLMAWADMAVTGAGSTCWELAFMGLPSLLIVIADNQQPVAEGMDAACAAKNLGHGANLDPIKTIQGIETLIKDTKHRAEMSRHGRELVDGDGASRVVMRMTGAPLRLRVAREEDCRLLWEWVNEPEMRASAFSTGSIPWVNHVAWFERKLHDPNCRILIGVNEAEKAFGQVRFDWNEAGEAEVDVSLDESERGSGLGRQLLDAAAKRMFRESSVQRVHAYVKPDNVKSLRVFEKASFKNLGVDTVRGHQAIHFARAKVDE
jgi:UDP-2,4-diacetamido-2,4,6-trideoxy-beta-L-altropyranose hydrolase